MRPEIMAFYLWHISVTWVSFCNLENKWSSVCSAKTGYWWPQVLGIDSVNLPKDRPFLGALYLGTFMISEDVQVHHDKDNATV